ncbi:MAG: hypothetical protein GX151_03660 [Gammaproteobacteria bacterium]|uniref:hypothetical protein n=1 Tax=Acinetobacter sp. A2 TaxID=362457 RepID=UPI001444B9B1|nr:hypothetical protein [Acinetobacter sp. A2]NLN57047.1 hypothetical protein [Gammaproteobacteria bacterium]
MHDNSAKTFKILQNTQNPSSEKMMFKKIQKNNSGQLRHTLNKFTEGLKVLLLPLLDFIDKAKVGICKVLMGRYRL